MELEGYSKTGKTKIFEPGEHTMIQLIPIIPTLENAFTNAKISMKIGQISADIPKEYTIIDIKSIDNNNMGSYLAFISENNVPVEAEEYELIDSGLIGYYDYGKKVQSKNLDEPEKVLTNQLKLPF